MSSADLVLSFLGGSLVGTVAGGWLGRWTERERPVRETMLKATCDYTDAMSAAIAALTKADATVDPRTARAKASAKCAIAVGTLGRVHVLFDEMTYQQAEEAVAALHAATKSESTMPVPRESVEPIYRHLRAFADCAGAEIRRPVGFTRHWARYRLPTHVNRQRLDDKRRPPPESPLMDAIDPPD
jgi:hypothetical protein